MHFSIESDLFSLSFHLVLAVEFVPQCPFLRAFMAELNAVFASLLRSAVSAPKMGGS